MKKIGLVYLMVLFGYGLVPYGVYGQDEEPKYTASEWCGTVDREKAYLEKRGVTYEDIEAQLQRLIAKRRLGQEVNGWRAEEEDILTIPLVFHVIYPKGAALGTKGNLRDDIIHQQVAALNQHFSFTNDSKRQIPDLFRSLGMDTKIRFALAKRDPNGLPTSGIVRGYVPPQYVRRFLNPFLNPNISAFEGHIYNHESPPWDVSRYANVYVFPVENMVNLGGYASFPLTNLVGLGYTDTHGYNEGGIYKYSYDGFPRVVMNSNWLTDRGRNVKGAITVHEFGHFLGLRHNWGDGGCGADDYCEDTPRQEFNYGSVFCISYLNSPRGISCGSIDAPLNYMDYMDEGCMAFFTPCQKERMRTVLNKSYNRKILSKSGTILTDPVASTGADLAVIGLKTPFNVCESSSSYDVEVEVANFGTESITSYQLEAYIGNTKVGEKAVTGQNIQTWHRQKVSITGIARSTIPRGLLEVRITQVNGAADTFTANNSRAKTIYFPTTYTPSTDNVLVEDFNHQTAKSTHWILSPEADALAQQETRIGSTPNNKALVFPLNTYTPPGNEGVGSSYTLLSPIIQPPNPNTKDGHFIGVRIPFSYTPKKNHFADGIIYQLYRNPCTHHPSISTYDYLTGPDLTSSWYSPNSSPDSTDWSSLTYCIQKEIGNKPMQLAIKVVNGGGNDLYLDDIALGYLPETPFRLENLHIPNVYCTTAGEVTNVDINPSARGNNYNARSVHCGGDVARYVSRRIGTPGITQAQSRSVFKSCVAAYASLSIQRDLRDELGRTRHFDLTPPAKIGSHRYVSWLEGAASGEPNEHALYQAIAFIDKHDIVETAPLTYDFSTDHASWIAQPAYVSKQSSFGASWGRDASGGYLKGSFYGSSEIGSYVLLSPVLNFANKGAHQLQFEVSYARRANDTGLGERLRVVVLQEGCNLYTGQVVYDKHGAQGANKLSTADAVSGAWTPSHTSDWRRETVDISQYASAGAIQLAFVASNLRGNNLYIDNISVGATTPALTALSITPSAPTVADGTAANVEVATLSATHTALGHNPTIHYSIVGWTSAHAFKIEFNKLKTNQIIDRSANSSHSLRLLASHRAHNGVLLTQEKELVITVTASSSSARPQLRLTSQSVVEGASVGTEVARLITEGIAFPSDHLKTVAYSISGGNEGGYFGVRDDVLYVSKPIPLRAQAPSHSLRLRAQYGALAPAADKWVSITVESNLVLGSYARSAEVEVYPNPANRRIHVRLPRDIGEQLNLSLLDANGRLIQTYQPPARAEHSLPLPEHNTGNIYFLRIESPSFSTTRRVIVE